MNTDVKLKLIQLVLDGEVDELYAMSSAIYRKKIEDNVPNMPPLNDTERVKTMVRIVEGIKAYRDRVGTSLMQAKAVCEKYREDALTREKLAKVDLRGECLRGCLGIHCPRCGVCQCEGDGTCICYAR